MLDCKRYNTYSVPMFVTILTVYLCLFFRKKSFKYAGSLQWASSFCVNREFRKSSHCSKDIFSKLLFYQMLKLGPSLGKSFKFHWCSLSLSEQFYRENSHTKSSANNESKLPHTQCLHRVSRQSNKMCHKVISNH